MLKLRQPVLLRENTHPGVHHSMHADLFMTLNVAICKVHNFRFLLGAKPRCTSVLFYEHLAPSLCSMECNSFVSSGEIQKLPILTLL